MFWGRMPKRGRAFRSVPYCRDRMSWHLMASDVVTDHLDRWCLLSFVTINSHFLSARNKCFGRDNLRLSPILLFFKFLPTNTRVHG